MEQIEWGSACFGSYPIRCFNHASINLVQCIMFQICRSCTGTFLTHTNYLGSLAIARVLIPHNLVSRIRASFSSLFRMELLLKFSNCGLVKIADAASANCQVSGQAARCQNKLDSDSLWPWEISRCHRIWFSCLWRSKQKIKNFCCGRISLPNGQVFRLFAQRRCKN